MDGKLSASSKSIHLALEQLAKNKKPDFPFGFMSKVSILSKYKEEIISLFESGYSPKQIAQAISESGFSVASRTITILLMKEGKIQRKKRKRNTQNRKTEIESKQEIRRNEEPEKSYQFSILQDPDL